MTVLERADTNAHVRFLVVWRSLGILASLTLGTNARAQSAAPAPAPAPAGVPITFRSLDADGALRVEGPGIAPNGGLCPRGCTLMLPPGNYTVHYSLHGKTTPLPVALSRSSDVLVSPPSSAQRITALALIIGGGLAFTAGAATLYVDTYGKNQERQHPDDPQYSYTSPDWLVPVYVVGALGLGVGMLGAVLLFTASPSAEVLPKRLSLEPRLKDAANRSRFLFAPTVTSQGGGLRVGYVF
jgi:hypothetical protein